LSVARPGHGRNGGLPSLRARGQRLIRTLGETHVGARADAAGARWLLRSPLAEIGGAALSGLDRVVDDPDVLRVGPYVVRYLSLPSALVLDLCDRVPERGPLCVKPVVACSCAGDCGRCSPVSSSFLPAPASRSRAGLQLDSGSAPAGSALIRSRRRCERSLVGGGGFRVGGGPGVACPKSRSIGV